MPIYEFQCTDCNHVFEHLTTTSHNLETPECPKCKSLQVRKLVSASAVRVGKAGPSLPGAAPSCSAPSGFS